jgi:hypothetical protein
MKLSKEKTNRQTANKMRLFFDNSIIIALPNACHFDGDIQPRWLTQSKNGNHQTMLNHFQHGLTVAIFCSCGSACLA